MKRWVKITVGLSSVFVILIIIGSVLLYTFLKTTNPVYLASIKVYGLDKEIEIYRDSLGIPYIFAKSDEDNAFALGYLHAQERLFQMDISRRAAEGRLSEVFGRRTLQFDKMFLNMGMKHSVLSNLKNYSDTTIKILTAYSNGVNEYIRSSKGKLSLEFDLLKYEPYEWKPEHSLMLIKMMAWELNISLWADIAYLELIEKFGLEKAKEIIPDYPENGLSIIPPGTSSFTTLDRSMIKTDREFRQFAGITGSHIGSNNWVVSGVKSISGKPVIANDPHLAFQAPGKWYSVVIKNGNQDLCGVTVPGVPVVVIGKNQCISWVLTNVMADDADFYCETLDSAQNNYYFNGKWNKLGEYEELIRVKDSLSVRMKIKSTHRGPIISENHPFNMLYGIGSKTFRAISMCWTANRFSDEFLAYHEINHAKNWTDFNNAISKYSVPGQNFVYADTQGNIGYICGAKLPIRKNNSPTFLNDGATDQNDWTGFVPYDEMPRLFNPPQNYIASANNKTIKNYKYHISNIWEPASRIMRIHELLESKAKHSPEDFMRYQNDIVSKYASEVVPYITEAFNKTEVHDKNLMTALKLLKKWDFRMDQYDEAPAIYQVFFNKLLKNILYKKLGEVLYNEYVFVANIPYRVVLQLLKQPNSSWFDNPETPVKETRDAVIRESLSQALTELENRFGHDTKNWRWGSLHKVSFKHFFSGAVPFIDKLLNIGPFNIGGDGTTLFNTEYSFGTIHNNPLLKNEEYENILGPSMRYIYDFAKPDEFYLVLTTGQSGHVFSSHYKDMTGMWLEGRYVKVRTDEASIRKNKDVLHLY